MTTYKTSNGKRINKSVIDLRVKNAKQIKLSLMDGFFCQYCGTTGYRLDMSHKISVKECQESGRSEIAYDLDNLELLCRSCHMEFEKQSKEEREKYYHNSKQT